MRRFRRVQRRKAERRQSRLEWRRPGAVWAADFKECREPIEGRYGYLLSVKDLASRYQLVWLPVEVADGELVRSIYTRLFTEYGRPLVVKSDNGGPFRDDDTKRLLAQYEVVPLSSPKHRPSYNGGVERANGQLAGYQEAVAEFRGRRAGPTCTDAETARQLANDLARPDRRAVVGRAEAHLDGRTVRLLGHHRCAPHGGSRRVDVGRGGRTDT